MEVNLIEEKSARPNNGEVITFRAIGYVENEFNEPESPDTLRAAISRIVLKPALVEGLHGLTPGSKILVIFNFHLAEGYNLLQHPRGDKSRPKRGVFALRSPYRPNHIGITEVELLTIENNVLSVRGLDALNGTPVLDIKPAG
jgi:tRNA-Thr(GGU) m(6)t(6)A37 methyltransferase TsaA